MSHMPIAYNDRIYKSRTRQLMYRRWPDDARLANYAATLSHGYICPSRYLTAKIRHQLLY